MAKTTVQSHYDGNYFDWQKNIGAFGGRAEQWKFQSYVQPSDNVIDYGCGGGYILSNLKCGSRIGVEINPAARANCKMLGVNVTDDITTIGDGWADVVISNHALEHVTDPMSTLSSLRRKMRPGATMVLVVPCESVKTGYIPDNTDYHLYTWSPMNIGNLVHAAGFDVIESTELRHRWLPRPMQIQKLLGWKAFHAGSKLRGTLSSRLSQVRVIAKA